MSDTSTDTERAPLPPLPRIEIEDSGGTHRLTVDGLDISNNIRPTIVVELGANSVPTVSVDLAAGSLYMDFRGDIELSDSDTAALKAMRWTPPDGQAINDRDNLRVALAGARVLAEVIVGEWHINLADIERAAAGPITRARVEAVKSLALLLDEDERAGTLESWRPS